MKLLVTGAAGFIGSNFVRYVLRERPGVRIAILDALTYAGNLSTIADLLESGEVTFYPGKIQDATVVEGVIKAEQPTHLVNFAAETHNDRSILEPGSFIQTDVYGTYVLLEATRQFGIEKMVHVSTDEVYGTIDDGQFTEESSLEPNTPYSAAKAGGDLQVRAHHITFKTPALVTRGGNNYGPWQYPEKLIPFFVTRLIDGKKVPLYGEGDHVREWIHVLDHCSGILTALDKGQPGDVLNIGDSNERRNRDVVQILLDETGRDDALIKRILDPRKGAHDKRYSMRSDRMRSLGWAPNVDFDNGLRETVRWYVQNEAWWRPLVAKPVYQDFIRQFYGPSLGVDL
ncbi:MAG: dTDP-glucose 4,6-dehydratase [Fimbriimonadaceae bacterium]|nr:dTDP-glucose 4,6-dehydratase [Fimbriimonadaceae bacterium]